MRVIMSSANDVCQKKGTEVDAFQCEVLEPPYVQKEVPFPVFLE
jgi:hypothetical protein